MVRIPARLVKHTGQGIQITVRNSKLIGEGPMDLVVTFPDGHGVEGHWTLEGAYARAPMVTGPDLVRKIRSELGTSNKRECWIEFFPEDEEMVLHYEEIAVNAPQGKGFTPEFRGLVDIPATGPRVANYLHGTVVDALVAEFRNRGLSAANNRNMDLYLLHKNEIRLVAEVKTQANPASVYSLIGQLLVYTHCLASEPLLVAVTPQGLHRHLRSALSDLGIGHVAYRVSKARKVKFSGLDELSALVDSI